MATLSKPWLPRPHTNSHYPHLERLPHIIGWALLPCMRDCVQAQTARHSEDPGKHGRRPTSLAAVQAHTRQVWEVW